MLSSLFREKLAMSTKEEDFGKESKKPDYDKDKDNDQLEVKQEEETGEKETSVLFLVSSSLINFVHTLCNTLGIEY